MDASRINLMVLRAELASLSAEVAIVLLGEPNRKLSTNRQLRFGRKGSLALAITGPKNGSWYDYENDVGGDLVDLIRREHGGSFRASVEYAQRFIGHERTLQASSDASVQCRVGTTHGISVGNRQRALELWEEGLPIVETPAARHLAKRGIVEPAVSGDVLRFHPSCPYGDTRACLHCCETSVRTNRARFIARH
jgi:putative DNA primase/helicase